MARTDLLTPNESPRPLGCHFETPHALQGSHSHEFWLQCSSRSWRNAFRPRATRQRTIRRRNRLLWRAGQGFAPLQPPGRVGVVSLRASDVLVRCTCDRRRRCRIWRGGDGNGWRGGREPRGVSRARSRRNSGSGGAWRGCANGATVARSRSRRIPVADRDRQGEVQGRQLGVGQRRHDGGQRCDPWPRTWGAGRRQPPAAPRLSCRRPLPRPPPRRPHPSPSSSAGS
jgi:hypothetical protein